MAQMTKDTFAIKKDEETGREYVFKKEDEMNKNNRENNKIVSSGVMPAKPGDQLCPVLSFKLYLSKLNSNCSRLWQRPRNSFLEGDTVWYCAAPLGEKSLSKFMSTISSQLNLSTRYANHSICATGATLLSRANFNNAQIMSVTGHKSVSSLAVYQKVSTNEKISMGDSISKSLESQTSLISPSPRTQSCSLSSAEDFCPMNLEDFDTFIQLPRTNNANPNDPMQQIKPLFNNCMISNLTINFNR